MLGGVLLLIGIENSFPITVIAVSFTGASFHGVMAISLDFAAEVGYPAGPGHASGYLMAVSCLFGGFAATFMSSSVYDVIGVYGFLGIVGSVSLVGLTITVFMTENLKRLREDVHQAQISYREMAVEERQSRGSAKLFEDEE